MGSGTGGKWLIIMTIYFLTLSVVTTSYIQAVNSVGLDNDISVNQGFGAELTDDLNATNLELNLSGTFTLWDSVKQAFGLLTGFSANLGIPTKVKWMFAGFFFYIPLLITIIAGVVMIRA